MTTKQPKTPPITEKTRLLCFDLESNGLHGEVFAVGAVVIDASGEIHNEFTGRCKIEGQVDAWVEQHVVPKITDMPLMYANYKDLREAFWKWYLKAEEKSDYVLVSNGYPVEYRFLLKCQEENIEERYWQHPFPLLELTSLVLLVDNDLAKNKQVAEIVRAGNYRRHHPLDDAKVSATLAFEAFGASGKIPN